MKFKRISKNKIKKSIVGIIILLIILNTILFIKIIGNKLSENIYLVGKIVLNNLITDNVNANIKKEVLKKYNINDLIVINKDKNDKVISINYNLEKAYELLIDIKISLMNDINNINKVKIYDAYIRDNNLFLKIPVYNYTNNLLITNIGPEIETSLTFMKTISGNVYTKASNYGINSLKLDLYVSFTAVNDIVVPFEKKQLIKTYELLIASKVIQGEIPSIYNGLFESSSDLINVN